MHIRRFLSIAVFISLVLTMIPISPRAEAQVLTDLPGTPTVHPILGDLNVRRAIAYCTDKDALVAAAYPGLSPVERQALIIDSFLPPENWAYHSPAQQYPFNPAVGQGLMTAAGWTLPSGSVYRQDSQGKMLAIMVYSTTAAIRQAYLNELSNQMRDNCGIMLMPVYTSSDWLFGGTTALSRRDFEISAFAWQYGPEPELDLEDIYGCAKIPAPENNWSGQNYTGWCNQTASDALAQASNTGLTQPERQALYAAAQDQFALDLPVLPLFRRSDAVDAWEHLDFNLQVVPASRRPLSDIKVRKAIAYCTDKTSLVKAVYPLLSNAEAANLTADSFLPSTHWAYSSNITHYTFNPTLGQSLLNSSGWTLAQGDTYRKNAAGDELAIQLTTTSAGFRQAWASVLESQMSACGIRLVRRHVPASWLFSQNQGLQHREFEMAAFTWIAPADPEGSTIYDCAQIPSPANNWSGQNYSGWCNEKASRAIRKANNTFSSSSRVANYKIVQQEYTADLPVLPLFFIQETFAHASTLTGLGQKAFYYTHNIDDWSISGKSGIVIGSAQEPDSLFGLVSSYFMTGLITTTFDPNPVTTMTNGYEAKLLRQIPSMENGLAQTTVVSVNTGDTVIDTAGNVVQLQNGVMIETASGKSVVFDGTPLQMTRLLVTYKFKPGIRWSDGHALVKSDFELGYNAACSPAVPVVSRYSCDRVSTVAFLADNSGYAVSWVPGYQSPEYFIPPFGYFPSHRVISTGVHSGKTLAQVPFADWVSLPELTQTPIGVGPYAVASWVHGDHITLTRNPYYVNGLAIEENVTFKFGSPENIVAGLLNGSIDFVGSETLGGVTQALIDARNAGKLTILSLPGASFEHIDLYLDPLPVQQAVSPALGGTLSYADFQDDLLTVTIPAGAVNTAINLVYEPANPSAQNSPTGTTPAGLAFSLTAYDGDQQLQNFAFANPVDLNFKYSDSDVFGLDKSTLDLYYWDGAAWQVAANSCSGPDYLSERDPANNTIHIHICHLSEFGLFGEENTTYIYLPILRR